MVYSNIRLLKKLKTFSTGFLRPEKVDKSYRPTFKILKFTQVIIFNFYKFPVLTNVSECYVCSVPVHLCNIVVLHKFNYSCKENLKKVSALKIMKKLRKFQQKYFCIRIRNFLPSFNTLKLFLILNLTIFLNYS